jgi:hypothetical protein
MSLYILPLCILRPAWDWRIIPNEDLCEGEGESALRLHLTELCRVIQRLMDATFAAQDQELKVLLAGLEYEARLCKREIEGRLGVGNRGRVA